MLFRQVVFLVHVPLKRGKDLFPVKQRLSTIPFELPQRVVCCAGLDARLWPVRPLAICANLTIGSGRGDGKVLELLTKYNDSLFGQQRILLRVISRRECLGLSGIQGRVRWGKGDRLLEMEQARIRWSPIERILRFSPEAQNVVETLGVELEGYQRIRVISKGEGGHTSTP